MNQKAGKRSIFLIVLLSLLSIIPLKSLQFDVNIENLLPSGDADLKFYREFQYQFQPLMNEEEIIFIGLQNHAGIFHQDFLKKTDKLTQYLSSQPQIVKVYSVTNSNIIFFADSQVQARPLIHITQPEFYQKDSVYLFQSKEYRDHLVSSDGKTIAVAAFYGQHLTRTQKNALLLNVEQKLNDSGFDKTYLISKFRGEKILAGDMIRDGLKMAIVFILLIGAFMFFMFRSFALMSFPIVVIIISNLWILALLSLAGYSLDILTSYLPLLITALSIAVSIPIIANYKEALKNESSDRENAEKFMKIIRPAIQFVAVLLMIGFTLVAVFTNVASLRIFFLFASAGVLISYIVSRLLFPVCVSMISDSKITVLKEQMSRQQGSVSGILEIFLKNKRIILLVSLPLVVVVIFFSRKIESKSFINQIPEHSALIEDYKFMEEDFSGSRPFEMVLSTNNKNHSFLDLTMIKMVDEVEVFLNDSCGVGAMISPLSLFKGANKAFHKGEVRAFALPASQQEVTRFYEAIMQTEHADELRSYMLEDGSSIRISGRLPALSPEKFKILSKKIRKFFDHNQFANSFSYTLTGNAILFDKINENIERNILTLFAVFFITVIVFCFYRFKSLSIVFFIFIPFFIPLLITAVLVGWTGTELKTDAVIIFATVVSILVSNSLFLLGNIKSNLSQAIDSTNVLKNTYLHSGKTLILTSAYLLILSFSMMLSGFDNIFHAGLVLTVCIISSLIVTLVLLPALAMNVAKKRFNFPQTAQV